MIVVSANELKDNLFKYLDEITKGEKIIIQKDKKIAYLSHIPETDWRDKMSMRPKLLVSPEKIIEPMTDIWEEFVAIKFPPLPAAKDV